MAYTQADLDKIQATIASGVSRSRFKEMDASFRSLEELTEIERRINGTVTATRRPRAYSLVVSKGLDQT